MVPHLEDDRLFHHIIVRDLKICWCDVFSVENGYGYEPQSWIRHWNLGSGCFSPPKRTSLISGNLLQNVFISWGNVDYVVIPSFSVHYGCQAWERPGHMGQPCLEKWVQDFNLEYNLQHFHFFPGILFFLLLYFVMLLSMASLYSHDHQHLLFSSSQDNIFFSHHCHHQATRIIFVSSSLSSW